jgi:hypothetical protein
LGERPRFIFKPLDNFCATKPFYRVRKAVRVRRETNQPDRRRHRIRVFSRVREPVLKFRNGLDVVFSLVMVII